MLLLQLGARLFGADAAAREKGKLQRQFVGVGGDPVVEAASLVEPKSGEIQLRKPLLAGRIRSQLGDALLRIQRTNLRPGG